MTITLIDRLADDPRAFDYVLGAFETGQSCGYFPDARSGPDGEEHCLLASEAFGGLPVGFVTFFDTGTPRGYWLDLLWVELAHRRIGLGTKLITAAQREVVARGGSRLELGTTGDNKAMLGLAAKLRWQPTDYRFFTSEGA
jgi:GNAT superfamily N-acetyltransferase